MKPEARFEVVDSEVVYPGPTSEAVVAAQRVDALYVAMAKLPQADAPLEHRFTPGLYSRELRLKAGTLVVTKIHKTEHQYVVSQGELSVWIDGVGVRRICAPYHGITHPGTRRVCYCHTDVVWTTFHPTNETDLEKIEGDVIFQHDPLPGASQFPGGALAALRQIVGELAE